MADVKDNNVKSSEEKSTDYSKKMRVYVLILLTVLVLGLIMSMFKTSTSPKTPPDVPDKVDQVMPGTSFEKQVEFQQNQLNARKIKSTSSRNIAYSDDEDDKQWESKELVRALDARKSSFGLYDSKSGNVQTQPASFRGGNISQRGSNNAGLNPVNPTTNSSEPGENIVGRAVDDAYPGKQSGDSLLVPTGTIADAVLDQDIVSDYTGAWIGHLIQDIYSVDNQFILLPKGTKITGQSLHVGNVNAPIQNRLGLTVEWAVLPNGKRIDFRKNTPEDQSGIGAFAGDVNRHFVAQFLSVAAYALISASAPRDDYNQNGYVNPTFQGQLADGTRSALMPFLMKYLSLVPTVTLRAGTPVKVFIQDDIYVKPWSRVNTTIY